MNGKTKSQKLASPGEVRPLNARDLSKKEASLRLAIINRN
ncbi:hypothetical protein SAMN05443144_1478 [Fodinibius roseus]|uniref:Uncharacterized protein n=1 Tax=Fodinibius roseus TaxID=1194090 RepID=A0A1M5LYP8_9BACT|nr:hypothetical protein SAMN05443144_1478 [Fodinibius roseus]